MRAGDFLHGFDGHIPGIRDIERPDGNETDNNRSGEFEYERNKKPPSPCTLLSCFNGIGRRLRKSVENDNESEEREQRDGGKFGKVGKSEEYAGENGVFCRRVFEKADEKIGGEKHEGGDADVGSD